MPAEATYLWQGKDRSGIDASGETSGVSPAAVRAALRSQGIQATSVRRKPRQFALFSGAKGGAPKAADIASFTRQTATLMEAGAPLVRSFQTIAEGFAKPAMRQLVLAVCDRVAGGDSFASALRRHPKHFDALTCSLVHAGEQGGTLEAMLQQIAGYQEKAQALQAKVRKAMIYPAAVVLVALVVSGILLVEVVPRFEEVFISFGAELPAFTRWVIALSGFAQGWWLPILISLTSAIALLRLALRRSPKLQRTRDAMLLKLPIAGGIIRMGIAARYARTLSTSFAAGVPLIEALAAVADAAGNILFEEAILAIREDVSAGHPLSLAMAEAGRFPAMMVQMATIGEEAGALDEMLARSAAYYEQQVDDRVDNLTALMEPLIMSVLGILIGGLIVAMYLPIFQLGAAVGG